MDRYDAKSIVDKYLTQMEKACSLELALNPDVVEEHKIGFVFFYNTKAYWETRDFIHALAGNGPLLVRRDNGEVVALPSNQSVERSLAELDDC